MAEKGPIAMFRFGNLVQKTAFAEKVFRSVRAPLAIHVSHFFRRRRLVNRGQSSGVRWGVPIYVLTLAAAACDPDWTVGRPGSNPEPMNTETGGASTTGETTESGPGTGGSTSGPSGSTSSTGGETGSGAGGSSGEGGADLDASLGGHGGTGAIKDSGSGCDASVPGYPGFCDNRIRTLPPTGNATIDALLKMTPETCKTKLSGDYELDAESSDPDRGVKAAICGLTGAVYWVADMDIDCDGRPTAGKCPGPDQSYQNDTALHGKNGALAAAITPYSVIPQNFRTSGLTLGTVVAVIYGAKLQFTVFGDTGPSTIIGEASYATAEKMGIPPSPLDGGVLGRTVTYIAFTGTGTVPGDVEDQAATKALGDQLVTKLIANNPYATAFQSFASVDGSAPAVRRSRGDSSASGENVSRRRDSVQSLDGQPGASDSATGSSS
jgi:Fungal chitosanase of glycosyl hydrolase group 75